MTQIIQGQRIAQSANLRNGSCAVIFNENRDAILFTRRTDNGQWCLPGGTMEPGESVEETCIREIWEETGLDIRICKLIGVYSSPHMVIQYADNIRWQLVSMSFEAEIVGGSLGLSDETTEFGYFTPSQIEQMDLMEHHRQRIVDAIANQGKTFIR